MNRIHWLLLQICLLCAVFPIFSCGFAAESSTVDQKRRWETMDYGPILSGTFAEAPEQWVLKGVIVRLGDNRDACVCYDMETLRLRAAWTGGFINFRGVAFDGEHNLNPQFKGDNQFATSPSEAQSIVYRGLYLNGTRTVLSYTLNECPVLELPDYEAKAELFIFSRTFQCGPAPKPIIIDVCSRENTTGSVQGGIALLSGKIRALAAGLCGDVADLKWNVTDGRIQLILPPSEKPRRFKLLTANIPKSALPDFESALKQSPENVAELIKGGPARWPQIVQTRGIVATGMDAYVCDTLTLPDKNPWNAWMRPTGIDFFADGRAAICTLSGDVWIVSGIDSSLEKLSWKRFATGLFQPLGLKIVNETIYVTGRDRITRLHDYNADGEADYYENFNSDCVVTPQYHEFAYDLQTDAIGNFYFAKGSPPKIGGGFAKMSIHSGCLFKVSKDGLRSEIVARGLRAPNGIAIGPRGEITTSDNQGSWVPSCPINWIRSGGHYGVPNDADAAPKRDEPLCWLPMDTDNSGAGQVWVSGGKWGPFEGRLLHLSYGKSTLFLVTTQSLGETMQGGVVPFPLAFSSGIMRARFNSTDGQLYVCGMRGWLTNAAADGTVQRVRYTGNPVRMPSDVEVTNRGLKLKFTCALDPATAADPENFSVEQFNVVPSMEYGSPEFKVSNPNQKGRDVLKVNSVVLQGTTLELVIPNLSPATNTVIQMKVMFDGGKSINAKICVTIHKLQKL